MITFHMEPNTPPRDFEEFAANAPEFSVAIDGYVSGGPRYDPTRKIINLNHHEGVSRLETRATCAQALMLVRQGLFDTFCNDHGNPFLHGFNNDCDQDVCLTNFILAHGHISEVVINPILNRIVHMEDMLDTTSGAYAFPPSMESYQEINWLFDPYQRFRMSGGLDRRIASEFEGVITDVHGRLRQAIAGNCGKIELDLRYKRIGGGTGWAMVEEIGMNARAGMFNDGIKAFVSVRQRPDGRYSYLYGRQSILVPFPLPKFFERFNQIEGCTTDCHGGGDTTGGSPRIGGSSLSPDRMTAEIEDIIKSLN